MSDDIVERLRDFQTWQFFVPECGHHRNQGATSAPIFVPEAKTKSGWIPVLCETGYSDGWRRYMFNPLFMLKEAADEIERLRAELVSMTDKFNRLKDAIPTTDEMTTPDFLATVEGAWILEWSQSQRQWHVGLMARTITRNRRSFLNGKPNDFVIIGIYPTASECSALRRYLDEGRESIDSQDNSTEENP